MTPYDDDCNSDDDGHYAGDIFIYADETKTDLIAQIKLYVFAWEWSQAFLNAKWRIDYIGGIDDPNEWMFWNF